MFYCIYKYESNLIWPLTLLHLTSRSVVRSNELRKWIQQICQEKVIPLKGNTEYVKVHQTLLCSEKNWAHYHWKDEGFDYKHIKNDWMIWSCWCFLHWAVELLADSTPEEESRGSPVKEISVLVVVSLSSIAVYPHNPLSSVSTHTRQGLKSPFSRGWLPSVGASHDQHTAVRKHYYYKTY